MIKLLGYFAELERWIVRKDEVFHPELIMRLHYTRSLFILFRFEPLLMETSFRFRPALNDIYFHLEQSTTSFNQRNRTELSISGTERNVSLEEAGLHLILPFDTLTSDTITTPVTERLARLPRHFVQSFKKHCCTKGYPRVFVIVSSSLFIIE